MGCSVLHVLEALLKSQPGLKTFQQSLVIITVRRFSLIFSRSDAINISREGDLEGDIAENNKVKTNPVLVRIVFVFNKYQTCIALHPPEFVLVDCGFHRSNCHARSLLIFINLYTSTNVVTILPQALSDSRASAA